MLAWHQLMKNKTYRKKLRTLKPFQVAFHVLWSPVEFSTSSPSLCFFLPLTRITRASSHIHQHSNIANTLVSTELNSGAQSEDEKLNLKSNNFSCIHLFFLDHKNVWNSSRTRTTSTLNSKHMLLPVNCKKNIVSFSAFSRCFFYHSLNFSSCNSLVSHKLMFFFYMIATL